MTYRSVPTSVLFGRLWNGWRLRPMDTSLSINRLLPSGSSHFIPHRSPSSLPPAPLSLILLPSYPFLECRRRGAVGWLRRCLGSGRGRPPRPGPRWVPGVATPKASPCSPAPRPACPYLRRATGRCGRVKRETEEALKVGFAAVTEADGDEKSGAGPPFMGRPSGSPSGGLSSGSGAARG